MTDRLNCTVEWPGHVRDLAIDDPDGLTTLADIVSAAGMPVSGGRQLVVDGELLPAESTLSQQPLRQGACITVHSGRAERRPSDAGTRLQLTVTSGGGAGRAIPLSPDAVVVGRDPRVAIVLDDPSVCPFHAAIAPAGDGSLTVTDLGSRTGTCVNDRPIRRPTAVPTGARLRFGALDCVVQPIEPDPLAPLHSRRTAVRMFARPPRPAPPPEPAAVRLPAPSSSGPLPLRISWAAVVAPVLVGLCMAVLFSPMMAAFALFGPVALVAQWAEDRRRTRRLRRQLGLVHAAEQARVEHDVDRAATAERRRRCWLTPDIDEVVRRAVDRDTRLWERRPGDDDFGLVRLGTASERWRPRVAPAERWQPVDPDVQISRELVDIPVPVAIRPGVVLGVAAGRSRATGLARALVAQLVVHHGPADLQLAVFAGDDRVKGWDWVKWLPHVSGAGVPSGRWTARDGEHAALARAIDANRGPSHNRMLVVIVDGDRARAAVEGRWSRWIESDVAVIVIEQSVDRLPALCTAVVDCSSDVKGAKVTNRQGLSQRVALCDLGEEGARRAALGLAGLDDPERDEAQHALPYACSVTDLLPGHLADAEAIRDRWRSSPVAQALEIPIGVGPDGDYRLDLVKDGPHCLIGGTTGSGKSELLRTLVIALASTFDPEHLSLLLIDYKGGSAFAFAADLPHTTGVVTDLDGGLAARALQSLDAEIRRRERVLAAVGVSTLAAYIERGCDADEPLPRLVVIVDELAALTAEVPDFVDSLVAVAQRGRSLGLHLVLATQRPSGVVSPSVRANTNIRIALRVQDVTDSVDLIGTADAAELDHAHPGRALVRVGAAACVPVQIASASAPRTPPPAPRIQPFTFGLAPDSRDGFETSAPVGGSTGLQEVVALLATLASDAGMRLPVPPWVPPLPDQVTVSELAQWADRTTLAPDCIATGLADDPKHQCQLLYTWSRAQGHVLVYGIGDGPRRSLVGMTVAAASHWDTTEMHCYAMDFGPRALSVLEHLPHVGAVVESGDRERQERLIRRLRAELERRRSASGRGDAKEPLILLLIDNFGGFRAAFDDVAGLALREDVDRIVADGPALGMFLWATADRPGAVPPAIADLVPEKLLLRLGDLHDALLFGVRPVPGWPVSDGRAIHVPSGLGIQLAEADPATFERASVRGNDDTPGPAPVGRLPHVVETSVAMGVTTVTEPVWELGVGIGDAELAPVVLRLGPGEGALVAGPARSGKSSALCLFAAAAGRHGVEVTAVALRASPLRCVVRPGQLVDDPAALATWLDAIAGEPDRPRLLVVDDADLVDDPGGRLAGLLQERRPGLRVLAAGRADMLRSQYGHWTGLVRRHRTGLLLRPHIDVDGELLSVALPRHGPATWAAGRGYLVSEGRAERVQVAQANADGDVPIACNGVPCSSTHCGCADAVRAKHHEIAREGKADD